jgi:hypothetical protein
MNYAGISTSSAVVGVITNNQPTWLKSDQVCHGGEEISLLPNFSSSMTSFNYLSERGNYFFKGLFYIYPKHLQVI